MRDSKMERSPIKDARFLERLDQLAKEAARLREEADAVAENMGKASYSDDVLGHLCGNDSFRFAFVVCGIRDCPIEGNKRIELQELFWDSVRTLVAAQFSGFSLESRPAIKKVQFKLMSDEREYWSFSTQENDAKKKRLFPRAFSLLSLYSILLPRVLDSPSDEKGRARSRVEALLRDITKLWSDESGPDTLLWRVTLLKLVSMVCRLAKGVGGIDDGHRTAIDEAIEKLEDREKDLRESLTLRLQDESAKPYEVADIVGVLGGRYLNPSLQIEPVHSALYSQAVEFVLKGRSHRNGSWTVEYNFEASKNDPLTGAYSPLAYLLDLPNSILMPCIEALADAADDALRVLKRQVARYALTKELPRSEIKQMIDAVYNGLVVGAAVSDRFKDLLSDAELDDLGAEVPASAVGWESLSDSLGFKKNLTSGVIAPWTRRSDTRPGAILVFGPPGTGKTTIAKALLRKLNEELRLAPGGGPIEEWRFLALSPADFAREGSDRVIASAEKMFRRLQRVRRCIVLLDEMEEFLRSRGPEASRESRLITAAFLPLLQETVSKRETILIVATNFVGTIDHAVTRRGRFDLILPLGPPDPDSRLLIIANASKQFCTSIEKTTLHGHIATYTMGYTREEIHDYLNELQNFGDLPNDDRGLEYVLWKIRQERVPMALSGNPGCDWRTFRDEAARFMRLPAGADAKKLSQKYWEEPSLPILGEAQQDGEIGKSAKSGSS